MQDSDECKKLDILIYRIKEDSPKASTGAKLLRKGLAKKISNPKYAPKNTIVLDPYAKTILSIEDWKHNPRHIMAVDRSWNKLLIDKKIGFLPKHIIRRRLPLFIASNPINYAKAYKLSTAEAIAASLHILGCDEKGRKILSLFKWGSQFYLLNNKIIEKYKAHINHFHLASLEKELINEIAGNKK